MSVCIYLRVDMSFEDVQEHTKDRAQAYCRAQAAVMKHTCR